MDISKLFLRASLLTLAALVAVASFFVRRDSFLPAVMLLSAIRRKASRFGSKEVEIAHDHYQLAIAIENRLQKGACFGYVAINSH